MVSIPPDTTPGTFKNENQPLQMILLQKKIKPEKYAQASRTLKACELCKQKTRCFDPQKIPIHV